MRKGEGCEATSRSGRELAPLHPRFLPELESSEDIKHMAAMDQTTLLRYVDEHLAFYLDSWKLFTYHNTFSLQNLQETLLAQCQQRTMTTQILGEQYTYFASTLMANLTRTLLIAIHYDSSAPPAEQIAPLIACFLALDAYQACSGTLPINLKWLFGGVSSDGTAPTDLCTIVAENATLLQADSCIYYDTDLQGLDGELILGTKGYLRVELAVSMAQQELPSHYGTIAPNAAWRLLWAINTLKDMREEIRIEGFYDTLAPVEEEAVALLRSLATTLPTQIQQYSTEQLLAGLHGQQLLYAHILTPTCTLISINSGEDATMAPYQASIPAQARAQLDFYLVPDQDPQTIFTRLKDHLCSQGFSDIQVTLRAAASPMRTPVTHPFVQSVRNATAQAYNYPPDILPMMAQHLPLAPFKRAATMPIVVISGRMQHRHGSHEQQYIQRIAAYAKQMALLIATNQVFR